MNWMRTNRKNYNLNGAPGARQLFSKKQRGARQLLFKNIADLLEHNSIENYRSLLFINEDDWISGHSYFHKNQRYGAENFGYL